MFLAVIAVLWPRLASLAKSTFYVHRRMFEQFRNYSNAQLIQKRKLLHIKKILSFQNQTHVPPHKTREVRLQTARKRTKTSEIPRVAFNGGLYKTRSLMCSKLIEVHAKSKLGWGMKIWYFYEFVNIRCPCFAKVI